MDCTLCNSLQNELEYIIYQDAHVFVLPNIEPVKEGHIMILPVRHVEHLKDLTPIESSAFLKAIDLCMQVITQVYKQTPMSLVNGWGFRSQPHLHAHVLPSKNGLRGLYSASEGVGERRRVNEQAMKDIKQKLAPFLTML